MDNQGNHSGAMKLMLCGCGDITLMAGPVSVHFQREEFFAFADGVGRLSTLLKQSPALLTMGGRADAPSPSHSDVCH